jgi:GrpB-like predicted nucleotidyltransferase (UPF0157 family)
VIEVVDYDPSWPERFGRLRDRYRAAMADARVPVLAIEHVGSTSVPGLAGKPVVDVDIVVEPDQVEPAAGVLQSLGFTPLGELGIPQRWAFRQPPSFPATNTYVIVAGSLSLKNHLLLRDLLRRDAALRDEYAAVKRAAGAAAADLFEYGQAKNDVIQRILAEAGLSPEELATIDAAQVPGPEVTR